MITYIYIYTYYTYNFDEYTVHDIIYIWILYIERMLGYVMHLHLEMHNACHSFYQIFHQAVCCESCSSCGICSLAWPKLQSNLGTPIWNEVLTQCHQTKMSLTRKSKMVVELLGGWNMRELHCFRGKKQNLTSRLSSSWVQVCSDKLHNMSTFLNHPHFYTEWPPAVTSRAMSVLCLLWRAMWPDRWWWCPLTAWRR